MPEAATTLPASPAPAPAPPTAAPPPAPPARPRRCFITWLGMFAMAIALLCFGAILIWQRISTGSFARGEGFELGVLGGRMLLAFVTGLGLLLIGSIIDSIRFTRWKKSQP